MLDKLSKITDSDALNRSLQEIIFPDTPFDNTIDLAENWTLETQDGIDYVKKNGLAIVCKGLKTFREKRLSRCIFAQRDMRSDVLGIPMAPGWQIALFDQCMDKETCNNDVIKTSVYNDVLTRECYDFIFIKDEEQLNVPEKLESRGDKSGDLVDLNELKPPSSKRRKKT